MPRKNRLLSVQPDLFDLLSPTVSSAKPGLPDTSPEVTSPYPVKPQKPVNPENGIVKTVQLNGQTVSYRLHRSQRRTIGFVINESGLRITAPKRCTLSSIENALFRKQKWILEKLAYHEQRKRQRAAPVQWAAGTGLPYLGNTLVLSPEEPVPPATVFHIGKNRLFTRSSLLNQPTDLEIQLKKWLREEAKKILRERLDRYAAEMGVRFSAFSLSNAITRWGSCSVKGHIRLNWRLIHCDTDLIDYVVIHELAHLREMNHSPAFWAIVNAHYPQYKKARQELHRLAASLFTLFVEN